MRYLPPVSTPILRATMTPLVDLGLMLMLALTICATDDINGPDVLLPGPYRLPTACADWEEIIVTVIDLTDPRWAPHLRAGTLDLDRPPILTGRNQVESYAALRRWLRERADGSRYPDPWTTETREGLRPSRRPLLIRCDARQDFGVVQEIIRQCWILPEESLDVAAKRSPQINKIHFAVCVEE